jgi:hypothetical protein
MIALSLEAYIPYDVAYSVIGWLVTGSPDTMGAG